MHRGSAYQGASAGIVLIGLGLLFLTGLGIWPWILVVIGLAGLPASLAARRGWYGVQGAFWLVGLAILFALNLMWPGILILAGVAALIGALTRGAGGSPFAADEDRREPGDEPPPEPPDVGAPTKRLD